MARALISTGYVYSGMRWLPVKHSQKCTLHLVQSLPLAVMVEWSDSWYKWEAVLCSALGAVTVGSVLGVGSCMLACTQGKGESWNLYELSSRLCEVLNA